MKQKICDLFSFSGRSPRLRYFFGAIILPLVLALLFVLFAAFVGEAVNKIQNPTLAFTAAVAFFVVIAALAISIIVIPLAFQVKRLHDMDHTGWWVVGIWGLNFVVGCLLGATPTPLQTGVGALVCMLPALYLLFWRGTSGENRFGKDQLQVTT